ncbi:MAG: TPM domain-containing protein [Ignavibacteria bacterium]|nr:TPM domain-containing protein [Ignavibacteria bacterium]
MSAPKVRHALLALLLAVAALTAARALDVPYLSGRVNDVAGVLNASTVSEIEALLKAYEDSSSNQIAVLIISTLDGESLEEYTLKVAETWKLGRKGVDNGVLLLIAKDDRKLRIEVGYGLEASLTDAVTSYIITRVITPRFKQGDFDGGVRDGVRAMISAADGKLDMSNASAPSSSASGDEFSGWGLVFFLVFWYGIVMIFTVTAILSRGCMSWFLFLFLIPFYAAPGLILAGTDMHWIGITGFLLYLIGFPILKLLFSGTEKGKAFQDKWAAKSTRGSSGGFFASGGSSSGWSSGGSSFSGGGGSFGGGGSSGSW